MSAADRQDPWTCAVGRVAMGQGRVDEWLVQVLIELLAPLTPGIVESLVGANNVIAKCEQVQTLIKREEYAALAPALVAEIRRTCTEIKGLDAERNKIVHSLYGPTSESDLSRPVFRSRAKGQRSQVLSLPEVLSVADSYDDCAQRLEAIAFELGNTDEAGLAQRVADLLELGFALARAGHLAERDRIDAVTKAIDSGSPLRVVVDHPHYRIISESEGVAPNESVITVNPANWEIVITDPLLNASLRTGDTGWRDVTSHAREEDPDVEAAFLRRVGDQVRYLQKGGDQSVLAQAQRRDALAERCFGLSRTEPFPIPRFLTAFEGFAVDSGPLGVE